MYIEGISNKDYLGFLLGFKDLVLNLEQIKKWYQNLPEKKKYIEFFSAILSLPVLITVIMLNLNNLNNINKKTDLPQPSPTIPVVVVENKSPTIQSQITPTETPIVASTPEACKKEIGPIEIISPQENEIITSDPVDIDIVYNKSVYCSVVWSYRIDGGNWSDYTDKSISLYNLTPGNKKLEVRVKSIASGDEIILRKSFTYQPVVSLPEPTISTATSSATTQ